MMGISFGELFFVTIVFVVAVPPEKVPVVVGNLIKVKKYISNLVNSFVDSEKKELQNNKNDISVELQEMKDFVPKLQLEVKSLDLHINKKKNASSNTKK